MAENFAFTISQYFHLLAVCYMTLAANDLFLSPIAVMSQDSTGQF